MSQQSINLSGSRVLVVEDDQELREALCDTLELAHATVDFVGSAEEAVQYLQAEAKHNRYVDMVVSDVNMGRMDGHELLAHIKNQYPQIPVLLVTAYGSISKSVDAIRQGAVDYLVKPFKPSALLETVSRYVSLSTQADEEPVAEADSSKEMLMLAKRVAATDSTILICGESGTGKEVLARYIHQQSTRKDKPFVAINCAAIPENMLEGLLFGHEKGAFTGAHQASAGKFEQANGGTLLLDEISEMDIGLQAKILRVIQEREVERLGGRKPISLNLRILATTNRDLQAEVQAGRFREDLYYRLSVFPLQWLPLRERRDDIQPIAHKLINSHASKMGRAGVSFSKAAQQALANYDWPGNIRELDNVMQRALIMQLGDCIEADDLRLDPYNISQTITTNQSLRRFESAVQEVVQPLAEDSPEKLNTDLKKKEFEIIIETLKQENGSRKNTATKLGISPRTLRYKIAQMRDNGLDPEALLSA